jgi:thiamine transport system substrate-binding protein
MMKTRSIFLILIALAATLLSGCGGQEAVEGEPRILTVMTHDSFAVSDEVLAAFEEQHDAEVTFVRSGDTGGAVNAAVLAAGNPFADVFYGVDNTFLSRALEVDVFEPYDSPMLAEIPPEFQLDPQNRVLPVDFGDVCLNYDLAYFEDNDLAIPASLDDLLLPEYAGLLAVANPASSSPGLAFLLATVGHFGDPGYLDFWAGLTANDLMVVNDWETLYYTEFSRWGGRVRSWFRMVPARLLRSCSRKS